MTAGQRSFRVTDVVEWWVASLILASLLASFQPTAAFEAQTRISPIHTHHRVPAPRARVYAHSAKVTKKSHRARRGFQARDALLYE